MIKRNVSSLTPFRAVLLALTIWRASSMLAEESGPWDMFGKLRVWTLQNAGPQWHGGLTCTWCNSVWLSTLTAVAYVIHPIVALTGALPLALSAASIVVGGIVKRLEAK